MKQFSIYVFKILAVVFVSMYMLDKLYTYTFQNGTPRNKIQKILKLQDAHYDYAFFGSSRTENHIDCELIEQLTGKSCVNFGISGGTNGDMLTLMILAESNKITFDNVVLQVDHNFNLRGLSNNFKASLVPFIFNDDVKQELKKDKNNFYYYNIPFYRYLKYDKVVGFRELLSTILNKKPKTHLDVGFNPKVGVGKGVSGAIPFIINKENEEIESIIKLMKKRGTNLTFFTAPYCKDIENRDRLRALKTRVPSLLDYVSIFDDKEKYFYNCGHLNIEGAEEFTNILIKDIYSFKTN
ncbi:hypothetical protein [uncultured Algibacter sp.]|uniref:hypothetical protein n=1 Tax=uncultured Algibacter sp. TaxID=298659 RepID=UPI0030EF97EF|tara:strand:+ start:2519 stop:3406 length:888 start_codon:yes stop_codon:yes gene_type:complete